MKRLFFLLIFFVSVLAHADVIIPQTSFSEEIGYTTIGIVEFDGDRERASEIMADFGSYEKWLLVGLRKEDPEAEKLTCTLNDIKYYPDRNLFRVNFSFNIFFLKHKEYTMPFLIKETEYDENGKLKSITLEADKTHKTNKFIAELIYTLTLEDHVLMYKGQCRLKGLAKAFFTLRLYKKNIEWYICRFASNFINEF